MLGQDFAAISGAAPILTPLVPIIVNTVYKKLNQFDITWDIMAKRHEGFTPSGAVVEDVSKLT